jgi:hypothetical protein
MNRIQDIEARNEIRKDAQLPLLDISKELDRLNTIEEREAFEAYFEAQYPKYKHLMKGVTGFGGQAIMRQIKNTIWEDFHRQRR